VVEAVAGRVQQVAARVELSGGEVTQSYRSLVFAVVPLAHLPRLASASDVIRIRTPYRREPSVESEGVALHGASILHGMGLTGAGVKVGVLDCSGFIGHEALLGGELPPSVNLWTGGTDPIGWSVHGTACAEIVHDMAPGAELYLAHDETEAEFYTAVDWLVSQGVDVISYSCSSIDSYPYDGGGLPYNPINDKVSEVRQAGVLWVNSAGNYANGDNYQAPFSDTDGDGWHDVYNGYWGNPLGILYPGESYYVILTWDDWPVNPATSGATQDYALFLWYWDGAQWQNVAFSNNPQNGNPGELPYEEFDFSPAVEDWYWISIQRMSPSGIDFLNVRKPSAGTLGDFNPECSVSVPANSPDVLAAGAIFWGDMGLEVFSSQGPTLGPGGTQFGGHLKPDLVAADGVSGATYGMSDGIAWPDGTGYWGTSASCPHIAGGAALLLEAAPGLTPFQLEAELFGTAVDLGAAGSDNLYGLGMMSLQWPMFIFADGFESGDTTVWSATGP